MADIANSRSSFAIDDDSDDEDDGPPSVFTDASAHLWTSRTGAALDDEKLGFITGADDSDTNIAPAGSGGSSWMNQRSGRDRDHHNESRELILMASRRLVGTPQAGNGSSFHIDRNGSDGDDFRQRSSIKLPTCCLIHRRAICATLMILTLFIILVVAVAPTRKNSGDGSSSRFSPPWADNDPPATIFVDEQKFNRIKDRILEHGISHASTLEDHYTPQYKALRWIVLDDERQLDLPSEDDESTGITGVDIDEEQTLFQRYALAVLWYQTNDLQIVKQSMTGSDVENPFETPFDPLELTEDDIKWNRDTNWMSSKGLCLWHGITCHPHDMFGEKYDGDFYVAILNLTKNNAHGIVPREVFTGFNKLKALDLSENELEGTIGRELGLLEDLEDLFIFHNNFSGVLPDEIGKLANLYNLYINDNKFRGRLPNEIGNLAKLRGISLFNNTFGGHIPDTIGNLKDVIALYLDENIFSGQIPTTIGGMTSLIDLRLRENDLSGTIPTELGNLTNIETIYLDTNGKITGPIPVELSNLAKLSELHMYEMNLNGPLPPELGLLQGLIYLYLDDNELTGTFPEELGELHDLEQLFVGGNNLSGSLPITIRGLTSLEMFRAAENELSGPIPTDLGKLTKLEYVYLEDNNFSGPVPTELGELTKLKVMHLHDSRLTGEMPPGICNLKEHFSLRDLTADCEDITCTCCTCDS